MSLQSLEDPRPIDDLIERNYRESLRQLLSLLSGSQTILRGSVDVQKTLGTYRELVFDLLTIVDSTLFPEHRPGKQTSPLLLETDIDPATVLQTVIDYVRSLLSGNPLERYQDPKINIRFPHESGTRQLQATLTPHDALSVDFVGVHVQDATKQAQIRRLMEACDIPGDAFFTESVLALVDLLAPTLTEIVVNRCHSPKDVMSKTLYPILFWNKTFEKFKTASDYPNGYPTAITPCRGAYSDEARRSDNLYHCSLVQGAQYFSQNFAQNPVHAQSRDCLAIALYVPEDSPLGGGSAGESLGHVNFFFDRAKEFTGEEMVYINYFLRHFRDRLHQERIEEEYRNVQNFLLTLENNSLDLIMTIVSESPFTVIEKNSWFDLHIASPEDSQDLFEVSSMLATEKDRRIFSDACIQAVKDKKPIQCEVSLLNKQVRYPVRFTILPEIVSGRVERLHLLGMDLREQKEFLQAIHEVLGNLSHDIKNKITPLSVALELLEMSLPSDSLLLPMIRKAKANCQAIANLAHDLASGAVNPESNHIAALAELDIGSLLNDVIRKAELQLPENGTMVQKFPSTLPHVLADNKKLERILDNLIGNAIDYTGRDEDKTPFPVEVSAEVLTDPARVRISVMNIGDHIPDDMIPLLGVIGKRVTTQTPKPKKSTGLGLSIVKGFLRAHGIELQVSSTLVEGDLQRHARNCFSFDLPISPDSSLSSIPE